MNIIWSFLFIYFGYQKYIGGKNFMPYFQGIMAVHLATIQLERETLDSAIYYSFDKCKKKF